MTNQRKITCAALAAMLLAPFSLAAGEQTPILIAREESGLGKQVLVTANHGIAFPEEKVEKRWNEDYYITSTAYTAEGWAIVMSQTAAWDDQTYKLSPQWPDTWIQQRRKDGYFVTSAAADGKNWIVALTRGSGITDQWAGTGPWQYLEGIVREMIAEGWAITSLAYNDEQWTVVMSLGTNIIDQRVFRADSDTDLAVIAGNNTDGVVTIIAGDDTGYILVHSRFADNRNPVQHIYRADGSLRDNFRRASERGLKTAIIGG